MMQNIRVCELFAGIGSQTQALKNLGIPHESIISEIDKFAIKSYEAIHGPTRNLGDISKVHELPDCDLVTYSFPCQDLSIAGLREGMQEGSGTRSSLLWEVGRLLRQKKAWADTGLAKMPEILLMENVPAILNKNNMANFQKWIDELSELGYTSSYAVLNAKDFGIPQNRKRCFMVSSLNGKKFKFPTGVPLDKCLRDMLDKDVAECYYFSDEKIAHYEEHRVRHKMAGHGFGWKPTKGEGIAVSVTGKPDRQSSNFIIDQGEYKPVETIIAGDLHHYNYECMNRVHDPEGLCPTIKHFSGGGNIPKIDVGEEKLRIRYITEKESWRLMGFPDEAFEKAKAAKVSKTQLYKQAGNSIVVNVLEAIFKGIYIDKTWE